MLPVKSEIERFLSKIIITENECWEWIGGKSLNGYGYFSFNDKMVLIHRFIYQYYHGTICPDLTIDHLCRNQLCVNLLHLEQVTSKVNTLRGFNLAAVNSRKTHCIRGHEFNKTNTYMCSSGARKCKTCALKLRKQRDQKLRMRNYSHEKI